MNQRNIGARTAWAPKNRELEDLIREKQGPKTLWKSASWKSASYKTVSCKDSLYIHTENCLHQKSRRYYNKLDVV